MDITGIGYVGITSANPAAWTDYAPKVLGMELGTAPSGQDDGRIFLRTDDRDYRFVIEPGERDDLAFIGWEVPGRDEYRAALSRFASAGVAVEAGDASLRKERGVRELSYFLDPLGYRHELFYGGYSTPGSFRGGRSHAAFDTSSKGAGHIVIVSPVPTDEIDRLFQDVMGFKFLTHGAAQSRSSPTGNSFLRPKLAGLSHCIAFAHIPGKKGLHHFGLPMPKLDNVGVAFAAAQREEGMLQSTIGRHIMDPVISFYHFTPSGFIMECYWEDQPWDPNARLPEMNPSGMSLWGHQHVKPHMSSIIRDA